jgi:hypothetical protein
MGHPQNVSDEQLKAMLNTWAKWDIVRQVIGNIALTIFIYTYYKLGTAAGNKVQANYGKKIIREEQAASF